MIRWRGHAADDVRDIGPTLALDVNIAGYAKVQKVAILTADFDFADIRIYPPEEYFGIAVIDRPENAPIAEVLELIESLLDAPEILAALPERLAIVDRRRIRLRPALPH